MKKYISILLCGALLVGFTACESVLDYEPKSKDDIASFCNSLLDLSMEDAERTIIAQGFTANPYDESYANKLYVAKMGDYTSSGGHYVYEKELPEFDASDLRTWLEITWLDGRISKLHYQISTWSGSLKEVGLASEEGLYNFAQKNDWDIKYAKDMQGECTRQAVIGAIQEDSLGYCSVGVQATDADFPQSKVFDKQAYGVSYTHKMGIDPLQSPSGGSWGYGFAYQIDREFRYIPQALYMPDDTIRVGEYLHKASTKTEDMVMDETRVHYSFYNDQHFYKNMGDWYNGCYYACGMAFFAPAGALDLEANTVTHTSSNEAILKVEQDECQAGKEFYEKIRIRAVAPGEATLTVRWKDLSTTARIVVIE